MTESLLLVREERILVTIRLTIMMCNLNITRLWSHPTHASPRGQGTVWRMVRLDDIDVWVRPQQDRVGSGLPDECVGVDGRRRDH